MNSRETLIIEGVRDDGSRLRPGDWVERISSMVAEFGPDHRLHYSAHVHPAIVAEPVGSSCRGRGSGKRRRRGRNLFLMV